MNREIKFRGWNKVGKRMVDLKALTEFAKDATLSVDGLFLPFSDDIELMQYTGLKDIKGRDIYEGDIVMYENDYPGNYAEPSPPEPHNDLAVVEWSDEARWNLNCTPFKKDNREDWADWIHEYGNDLEIIGNIHENPELLGAK